MQAWQRVMDIQMENIGEYGGFHNKEMSRCIFIKALQENGKTIRTDHEKYCGNTIIKDLMKVCMLVLRNAQRKWEQEQQRYWQRMKA